MTCGALAALLNRRLSVVTLGWALVGGISGAIKMPLRILWALLDLLTMLVLASGLHLWFKRGNTDARVREIERMAEFGNADGAQA